MTYSPVVITADLIAAGDQLGCTALIKATNPVTWGQDMEVPERILNFIFLATGDHAAKILSPGAMISGYKAYKYYQIDWFCYENMTHNSQFSLAFKISGVRELGPLEEKAATRGADCDFNIVFVGEINDVGLLKDFRMH